MPNGRRGRAHRNVLAALYDGTVSNDVASQAEAKFQINMLQHECDKMELVTAEDPTRNGKDSLRTYTKA